MANGRPMGLTGVGSDGIVRHAFTMGKLYICTERVPKEPYLNYGSKVSCTDCANIVQAISNKRWRVT